MTTIKLSAKQKHSISPYLYMQFMEPLGVFDSSLDVAWNFRENRWQEKVIATVRDLAPTMVRFGGIFASYYRWEEGIGKNRKPMMNYCWDGIYNNQVGTHEFVDFCRQVNAQPLIVVNMESDGMARWAHPWDGSDRLGTAEEAARWVDYCNNPDNARRKANGAEEPLTVKYWQIGNETSYVSYGLPENRSCFGAKECAEVTAKFAKEMRRADPSIKLIGWGDRGPSPDDSWCRRMADMDEIDLIAFHMGLSSTLPDSPLRGTEYRKDYEKTWEHLLSAYRMIEDRVDLMRQQCNGKHLALTECHFGLPGRNRNEVLSSWGAGVAYARCHNVFMRNSDILDIATLADFFGNVWQVNAVMIPTPVWKNQPYLQPVGSVMRLFGKYQGAFATDLSCDGYIDATASITGRKRFLHIANPDMHRDQPLQIEVAGETVKSVTMHYIAEDPATEITPLNPDVFLPRSETVEGTQLILPKAAVAAIEIELA